MPRLWLERMLMDRFPKPKFRPPVRQPKTIVYARCERTRTGIGSVINEIFMTTYGVAQWAEGPTCPNCGGAMVKVREGKMPL